MSVDEKEFKSARKEFKQAKEAFLEKREQLKKAKGTYEKNQK